MGNTLLLYVIITFVAVIVVIFSSVMAYSKAYRAKNRIVEVIEKYGEYNESAENEIVASLIEMGYQLGDCKDVQTEQNNTGYKYCIERKEAQGGSYYKVTTYIQFYFPLIQEFYNPPVTSETKILGKKYNY